MHEKLTLMNRPNGQQCLTKAIISIAYICQQEKYTLSCKQVMSDKTRTDCKNCTAKSIRRNAETTKGSAHRHPILRLAQFSQNLCQTMRMPSKYCVKYCYAGSL